MMANSWDALALGSAMASVHQHPGRVPSHPSERLLTVHVGILPPGWSAAAPQPALQQLETSLNPMFLLTYTVSFHSFRVRIVLPDPVIPFLSEHNG